MVRGKDPGLAAALSILIPGLGQVYNEQWKKAILVWIVIAIGAVLSIILIGFIVIAIVWIWSVWDAWKTAKGGS